MKKSSLVVVLMAVALSFLLLSTLCGCGNKASEQADKIPPGVDELSESRPYNPVFADQSKKLKETSSQNFTRQLHNEALAYEPLLKQPGTQVHMGYWSGAGNHGSLVRLLDAINASTSDPPQKAIWDEGVTTSNQFPSYDRMLEQHWYERANPVEGKVTIYGKEYTDPHPVTFEQADEVWGQYSQRYADMAELIRQVAGKPIKAWCFIEGAKANRIFYKYELPELRKLEQAGSVQVYFARTKDADWSNPDDWIEGTANAPEPVPAK